MGFVKSAREDTARSESAHFFLLKISPFALILDHVSFESLWVSHDCGRVWCLLVFVSLRCIDKQSKE